MAELSRQAAIGFQASGDEQLSNEQAYQRIKDKVEEQLKREFRPEFLNRLDKIIVFRPLDRKSIRKIVDIQTEDLCRRLASEDINLDITEEARNFIAEHGFDPEYGARPIRRAITDHIEDPLSESLLASRFSKNQTIRVLRRGNKLVFRK